MEYDVVQYYKPVILDKHNKVVKWWDRNDCASFNNDIYEFTTDNSYSELMNHSWRDDDFVGQIVSALENNPQHLVWAGSYTNKKIDNIYVQCTDNKKSPFLMIKKQFKDQYYFVTIKADKRIKYAINHTKNKFVDLNKLPKNKGKQLHALPLLTCEGNGRGINDYYPSTFFVGSWARDIISTQRLKSDIPSGCIEIIPMFK